ncbi:MAG TPA: hypothetical protein VN154_04275 [Rhizomicrobium sp.]|nr:hypothetical protein [Rhizomicrobium sp.]
MPSILSRLCLGAFAAAALAACSEQPHAYGQVNDARGAIGIAERECRGAVKQSYGPWRAMLIGSEWWVGRFLDPQHTQSLLVRISAHDGTTTGCDTMMH